MADKKAAASLYDYLYKDRSKIASYYAQLFKGVLTSREEKSGTSETSEDDIGLSIALLKGQSRDRETILQEEKRIIDPNDFLATDLLSYLMDNGLIHENITEAGHQHIVMVKGDTVFIDNTIIDMLIEGFDSFLDIMTPQQLGGKNEKEKKTIGKLAKLFKKILVHNSFQPAFILKTSDDHFITGTLLATYMAEPILSLYLKHGAKGLSDIYIVGIKEESNLMSFGSQAPFLEAGGAFASAMSNLIFPVGSIHVSPIAIFRKIV